MQNAGSAAKKYTDILANEPTETMRYKDNGSSPAPSPISQGCEIFYKIPCMGSHSILTSRSDEVNNIGIVTPSHNSCIGKIG